MCPDRQILSLYADGELPSPWKEKLESHLPVCARCREELEAYRKLSRFLAGAKNTDSLEAAKERVLRKLRSRGEDALPRNLRLWQKNVSLPFPAAAAAAAVLLFFLGFFVFRQIFLADPAQDKVMAAGVNLDLQGITPVSDINGILQYLGDRDTGDIVILRLPESRNFMSSGEPRILKAAELPAKYSRTFAPSPHPGPGDYSTGSGLPR
ncbi:MAG: hypothetical protein LBC60_06690 [Spirochaetaceae bacterium]|jgi:hypothetical protein|nr:hypothetical protein [Spirochaetaceae bacterium]